MALNSDTYPHTHTHTQTQMTSDRSKCLVRCLLFSLCLPLCSRGCLAVQHGPLTPAGVELQPTITWTFMWSSFNALFTPLPFSPSLLPSLSSLNVFQWRGTSLPYHLVRFLVQSGPFQFHKYPFFQFVFIHALYIWFTILYFICLKSIIYLYIYISSVDLNIQSLD